MSSTLGCIGLAVNDMDTLDELVGRVLPDAEVVAEAGGLQARRWVDPSGASLTMTVRQQGDDGGVLVDLVPSYVGPAGAGPGVRVGVLTPHGQTLAADLVDAQGETLTRIACDLAQSLVAEVAEPRPAHLIALGLDVSVHADEAAFTASDADNFATGAVLAYGLFSDPEAEAAKDVEPTAYVSGTVLAVTSHSTELDQGFHAVDITTGAGTLTLCLAAEEHPTTPQPGNIVAGVCYLVLDVPGLW